MKRSPDTQINAFSHQHLENKMASFLLRSSLFSTIRPLASSDAMAYYRPAPGRTDGIPERDQGLVTMDYKSAFTNSCLVCQRNRSWIKGLGKNQQKEWTRSLFAVPFFVRGHRTVTPWTPRNDCMCTRQAPRWHTTCGVLTSLRATNTEIVMFKFKVFRLSMGKICPCIYGLRSELVNQWCKQSHKMPMMLYFSNGKYNMHCHCLI